MWQNYSLQGSRFVCATKTKNGFMPLFEGEISRVVPCWGCFHTCVCVKKHIHKVMVTCTTGFIPNSNRFELGGTGIKISFDRVGVFTKCKRTSYHRTTRPDGTFYYDKNPKNISKRKGESYFRPCEIKGSSEGTPKDPKFSLKKYYSEVEIPRLEKIVRDYET